MIGITAATGHLGHSLLAQLVGRDDVVAIVRDPKKGAKLPVQFRIGDYTQPEHWPTALKGIDTLLLIAGNEWGRRVGQHKNVIDAARKSGIKHLVYSSAPYADVATEMIFQDHRGTEELIRASGLTYTMLRAYPHHEVFLSALLEARQTGVLIGSAHDGRLASAGRNDFVDTIISVITNPAGHENKAYEMNGDETWSRKELAAVASDLLGRPVVYHDLSFEEHHALLVKTGVPAAAADIWIDSERIIASGTLSKPSGHLKKIMGRPTTPLREGLKSALEASEVEGSDVAGDIDFLQSTGLTWLAEKDKVSP